MEGDLLQRVVRDGQTKAVADQKEASSSDTDAFVAVDEGMVADQRVEQRSGLAEEIGVEVFAATGAQATFAAG